MTTADSEPTENRRQLHIEKGSRRPQNRTPSPVDFGGENVLADCKYFNSKLLCGPAEIEVDGESFSAILVIDGEGGICAGGETLSLKPATAFSCRRVSERLKFPATSNS